MGNIDISPYFSPDAIKQSFFDYKDSKAGLLKSDKIKIPMGTDGVTWQNFEHELDKNANRISQKVLSGKYIFHPFREVDIPKPGGGTRTLAIAGVGDALVQRLLYEALYQSAEEFFSLPELDQVSFAYRKGKSAPHAAKTIKNLYERGYKFALDADIKKFFDTLNHDRLRSLIDNWVAEKSLAGKLLWRFTRADRVPFETYDEKGIKFFFDHKPERIPRKEGVPQGGVLSGMLANLYLHEFDRWVIFELRGHENVDLRYIRYADDFVILTKERNIADGLLSRCANKLNSDLLIEMHIEPPKTKVSDISAGELEFVGFHFIGSSVKARKSNIDKYKERFKKSLKTETKYNTHSNSWKARLNITVTYCINPRILGIEPMICENCGYSQTVKRNWMAFFSQVVTDTNQLKQLDRWMREQVSKYFWRNYRHRLKRKDLKDSGMKTLVSEFGNLRRNKEVLCKCSKLELELDDEGWHEELDQIRI